MNPIFETRVDELRVSVFASNADLGAAAAEQASQMLRRAAVVRGVANLVLAAANSQLTFLAALREDHQIPWDKVNVFHMDEYLGLDPAHPASFPLFLRRNFVDFVHPKAFYAMSGATQGVETTIADYVRLLRDHPVDVCALGYGENGHLAFNDPPFADFQDPVWAKTIKLAEASRRQQVGEGHFATLNDVPTHAITLTIPALLSARVVLSIVPEARKADAVYRAMTGPVDVECPGSILRRTAHAHLFLDRDSAGRTFSQVGQ